MAGGYGNEGQQTHFIAEMSGREPWNVSRGFSQNTKHDARP